MHVSECECVYVWVCSRVVLLSVEIAFAGLQSLPFQA